MKIPRDLSGKELITLLQKMGYVITRQTGSHIRLTRIHSGKEQHLTIPNHNELKIGTLANILQSIAENQGIEKTELIERLWGS